jgi:hypothetical protein
MAIDASGNVGIGTASPGASLQVAGAGRFTDYDTLQTGVTGVTVGMEFPANIGRIQATTGATLEPLSLDAEYVSFRTGTFSGEKMRIDSSGNVGIGTDDPSGKLDVELGATGTIAEFRGADNDLLQVNSENNLIALDVRNTSNGLDFQIQGVSKARLDASGNVSLGTGGGITATGAKFQANSSSSTVQLLGAFTNENMSFSTAAGAYITIGDGATTNRSIDIGINTDGAGEFDGSIVVNEPGGALDLGVANATQAMRIDANGNLLVGSTQGLGVGVNGNGVQVYTGSGNGQIRCAKTVSGTVGAIANYHQGTYVGGVNYSNTATSFPTSSDVRLKENIVDAPAGNIDALKVRSFDWKADGSHQEYGFVAQELDEVAPYAVTKGETEDDTWGVDYSKLVPMLVKEIQDLKAEVAALKGA